jgi:COP9 signalosome complex subunit 1
MVQFLSYWFGIAPNSCVADLPKFDLESYLSNYKGKRSLDLCKPCRFKTQRPFLFQPIADHNIDQTKFSRALFIGEHCAPLRLDALKTALSLAKQSNNPKFYEQAHYILNHYFPTEPEASLDQTHINNVRRHIRAESERLENELKGYKNNLIKESIRMGNEDLGKFYESIGEYSKAYDAYFRMKKDVQTNKHAMEFNVHLTRVSILEGNWLQVIQTADRVRVSVEQSNSPEGRAMMNFVHLAKGLAQFSSGNFAEAARNFLKIDASQIESYNNITSPNDVAVYGGLCALASMDRQQLRKKVLDSPTFRTFLEQEPQLRRAITSFVNGRYSQTLSVLREYKNDYLLDIYLSKWVDELMTTIRSKSISQYFIPFSCVSLKALNEMFAGPGESIEEDLVFMIRSGVLNAKIDTMNGVSDIFC